MKIKNVHGAPILLIIISGLLIGLHYVDLSSFVVDENGYLTMIVLQLVIFALPSVFYARLRGRKYMTKLRFRMPRAYDVPLLVYSLGFMIFGGAILCFLMYRIMPNAFAVSSTVSYLPDSSGVGTGLYSVVAAGILPAITEEFLYRGVIMTEYQRNGVALAVILNSLCFALIHFNFVRLPVYFFYGVVLSLVLLATRSLVATIIVHMANNIAVMFFEIYVYRAAIKNDGGVFMFAFITVTAFLVFAVLMFNAMQRSYFAMAADNVPSDHIKRKKKPEGISYAAEALLSPAFIILVAVSIFGMFVCR